MNVQSSRNMSVEISPDMKYPPLPFEPSTKSSDKRAAKSDRDNLVVLSPVEVGVPSGASAVYCLSSFGSESTSFAIADDGSSAKRSVMDAVDEMRPFAIQRLRDERVVCLLLFGLLSIDSALQVIAAVAKPIDTH